jgi:hypothetical protein
MANTCNTCKHKERVKIDAALIRNESFRRIASQFDVGEKSVERHQQCIAELLQETQKAKAAEYAMAINDELRRCFVRVNKISDACDEWLTDPDDAGKYTLDARTGEIDVIYEKQEGEYQDGSPRWVKKRATLSVLLGEVENKDLRVLSVESKTADPRKLILDTANTMNGSIDRLAKLTGAYQVDRSNEHDRRDNREIVIEALFILSQRSDEPKTHEEIVEEVDKSMRAVNSVWEQAKEVARRKGNI